MVTRLAALIGADPADILTTLDTVTGSRFDPVRVARDIPEATARLIAESGVDYISIGALTHSAPALDLSLLFD